MDLKISKGFKIFSSILTGFFISSNIVLLVLSIILLDKSIDIVFSIINSSFLMIGFLFSLFFITFDKKIFKMISDSFLLISFIFILYILVFNNFFIINKWLIFGVLLLIEIISIILNSVSRDFFGIYTTILNIVILILLSILYLNINSRSFLLFVLSIIFLVSSLVFNLLFDRYRYNYYFSIIFIYLFYLLNYIIIFIYI